MPKDSRKPFAISLGLTLAISSVSPAAVTAADKGPSAGSVPYAAYYGNYRASTAHAMGIDRFINDSGDSVVLISDYTSGVVRRLFPVSETDFVMGPEFDVQSPAELKVGFVNDSKGNVTGIALHPTNGAASFAKRVPLTEQEISVSHGPVRLAGTLMLPTTKGPHPAIILLHGSGPLTRYSFGPYPHFFTSLGFAVLIYDKRGTGDSTGTRFDASTGVLTPLPAGYYPDDLVGDAQAVFEFIKRQQEIDPRKIGVWGSSEGGMLATQVAARNKDVAFAIDSSGFMGPLWQTLLYQAGATLKAQGLSAAQIEEAQRFTELWMRVARTGQGYDVFLNEREKARRDKKPWLFSWFSGEFTSLEQMRWDWNHILSFSPLPALSRVRCPVLGVFGEMDVLTDVSDAARSMRRVLADSGNNDFTVKVFANASHSLGEMPTGNRMAPGVFETLRFWLLMRVQTAERAPAPESN
jgi:pimeloyl-ACP methyl ester carboxylesterase